MKSEYPEVVWEFICESAEKKPVFELAVLFWHLCLVEMTVLTYECRHFYVLEGFVLFVVRWSHLNSSVSLDPSEIILIFWFGAQN